MADPAVTMAHREGCAHISRPRFGPGRGGYIQVGSSSAAAQQQQQHHWRRREEPDVARQRCSRTRTHNHATRTRSSLLCLPFSSFLSPALPLGVLGKRAGRDDDHSGGGSKRKKLPVPVDQYPDVNWPQAIFDFRHGLEQQTGVKLSLRGRGSQASSGGSFEADDDEDMYVLLQAESDYGMEAATAKVQEFLANPNARDQRLALVQSNFVSPLGKKEGNPETFALSNALYANDQGFTMMAPTRTPEQMREERMQSTRTGTMGLRPGEQAKDMWVEQDKGQTTLDRHTQPDRRSRPGPSDPSTPRPIGHYQRRWRCSLARLSWFLSPGLLLRLVSSRPRHRFGRLHHQADPVDDRRIHSSAQGRSRRGVCETCTMTGGWGAECLGRTR